MNKMFETFTKKQLIELLTFSVEQRQELSRSMNEGVKIAVKVVSTKELLASRRRSARV